MTPDLTTPTTYHCEDCEWDGTAEELDVLDHATERVLPGELMAAGQCPECGSLVGIDDADVPNYTIEACARIKRTADGKKYTLHPGGIIRHKSEYLCSIVGPQTPPDFKPRPDMDELRARIVNLLNWSDP